MPSRLSDISRAPRYVTAKCVFFLVFFLNISVKSQNLERIKPGGKICPVMGDFSPLNGRYSRFLKILLHAFVDTYCIMQWRNFQRVREGSSDPGGTASSANASAAEFSCFCQSTSGCARRGYLLAQRDCWEHPTLLCHRHMRY